MAESLDRKAASAGNGGDRLAALAGLLMDAVDLLNAEINQRKGQRTGDDDGHSAGDDRRADAGP